MDRVMANRLCARNGGGYLSPRVVVARIESEFAYVEADAEAGRRHVRAIISRLKNLAANGLLSVDNEYVERLSKAEPGSIYVYFGDDPGSELACLGVAVIPGEALYFDYPSHAHARATLPLLARCAAILSYDIAEA